jgi:hypothetical protein
MTRRHQVLTHAGRHFCRAGKTFVNLALVSVAEMIDGEVIVHFAGGME